MRKKGKIIASFVLCCLTIALQLAARTTDGFADWYAAHVHPLFVHTIGRICSVVPFSAAEFGLYALLLYVLYQLGRCSLMSWREKRFAGGKWMEFLCSLILIGSAAACMFTLTCGVNYFRTPVSESERFSGETYETSQLRQLCISLAEEINEASDKIVRDEAGMALLCDSVRDEAIRAMRHLGETYPILSGYYPVPKPVTFSFLLTYQYIMGVYSPFTLEANYNRDMMAFEIPYSICHELSHVKGVMREEEAGFFAYLACRNSDNPLFRYSGAMEAFSYVIRDYYLAAGEEAYHEIYQMLKDEIKAEQYASDCWWTSHKTAVQTVSSQVNDAYLKANNQEDGTRSYGRMVALLLEEYIQNQSTKTP